MRKLIFLLTAGCAVLFIVVLFFVFSVFQKPTSQENTIIAVPTKVPGSNQNSTGQTQPPIMYDTKKTNELIIAAKNKKALSETGILAKNKLVTSLNNTSGSVYTSLTIRIDYVKSPDVFQAEILSTDITSAKQEAVSWMTSQGFTQDDVCKLPLSFYLSPKASSSLQNTNTVFNPLPEGC